MGYHRTAGAPTRSITRPDGAQHLIAIAHHSEISSATACRRVPEFTEAVRWPVERPFSWPHSDSADVGIARS